METLASWLRPGALVNDMGGPSRQTSCVCSKVTSRTPWTAKTSTMSDVMRSCQNAIKVCYNVEDLGDPRCAPPPVPRAVAETHAAQQRRSAREEGRQRVGRPTAVYDRKLRLVHPIIHRATSGNSETAQPTDELKLNRNSDEGMP